MNWVGSDLFESSEIDNHLLGLLGNIWIGLI